jgi:hypothetical protein
MNNAALARQLEADLLEAPRVQAAQSGLVIIPVQPEAAPGGLLQRLWQRLFGPPAIDPRTAKTDFGVFRALYEIGSDHIPSSGTWPTP